MQTLESIRQKLSDHRGARVCYLAANGRRKTEQRTGIIKDIYPSLFTVFIEDQQNTVSFSYADILTKEVEIILESSGENLFS